METRTPAISIQASMLLLVALASFTTRSADAYAYAYAGRAALHGGQTPAQANGVSAFCASRSRKRKSTHAFVRHHGDLRAVQPFRSRSCSFPGASKTRAFMSDDDDLDDDFGFGDFDDDLIDDDFIDVEGGGTDAFGSESNDDEEEEEEEEEDPEDDPYVGMVPYEFGEDPGKSSLSSSSLSTTTGSASVSTTAMTTGMDWGGALGALRTRVDDLESGRGGDPSQALFRRMSADSPSELIGRFVKTADPQVVQAMSGAVTSLLGGLSNPAMGVDVLVRASGEKIGSLCFQLQMTGYMFRNAEYVLALKQLMKLKGNASQLTIEDYKEAFDRIDRDRSGYIEASEIQELFKEAYGGRDEDVPAFEVKAFLEFFDTNEDGRISWEEFEKGLTTTTTAARARSKKDDFADRLLAGMEAGGPGAYGDGDDDDASSGGLSETISGSIEIEMDDGKVVEVDAKEYMDSLREEARKLKLALRDEQGSSNSNNAGGAGDPMAGLNLPSNPSGADEMVDIAGYIASRKGDVRSLTEGIKPEIVDTMKKLVDFVLEGGDNNAGNSGSGASGADRDKEMELPGSALQQLALWQLVLGYKLREEEAKGDYINLLK